MNGLVLILLIVVLAGLAFNLALFVALTRVRQWTIDILAQARRTLTEIGDDSIRFEVDIVECVPVNTDFHFERTLEVPIKLEIPFATELEVPVGTPLGTFTLRVPVDTRIPVDTVLAVAVSEAIPIDTEVPVSLVIPVEIPLGQTSLAGYLVQTGEAIDKLRRMLKNPLSARRAGRSGQPGLGRLRAWLTGDSHSR